MFSEKANIIMFCVAFTLATLGICAGVARLATACPDARPSTVYYDRAGCCLYWVWNDEPSKWNPCGADEMWVPENAQRGGDE